MLYYLPLVEVGAIYDSNLPLPLTDIYQRRISRRVLIYKQIKFAPALGMDSHYASSGVGFFIGPVVIGELDPFMVEAIAYFVPCKFF